MWRNTLSNLLPETFWLKTCHTLREALTYIIGHYDPSVRITALLLTPHMLCVLISHLIGDQLFKVDSERQIFLRNLCAAGLFTRSVFARNRFDAWPGIRTWALLLISQHTNLLNYGYFLNQDYDLVFYTTYVVCANFLFERRDLQLNVESEQ